MKTFKLALLAAVAASVSGVAAAGPLGALSSEDTTVTVVKGNAVKLSGVSPTTVLTDNTLLSTDKTVEDAVCVYSSTGNYKVTATSANAGAGGEFNMEIDGGTELLEYSVSWSGTETGGSFSAMTSGAELTGFGGSLNVLNDFDCAGGSNARFSVTLASADYLAASTGTFTDTLTLEVAPE